MICVQPSTCKTSVPEHDNCHSWAHKYWLLFSRLFLLTKTKMKLEDQKEIYCWRLHVMLSSMPMPRCVYVLTLSPGKVVKFTGNTFIRIFFSSSDLNFLSVTMIYQDVKTFSPQPTLKTILFAAHFCLLIKLSQYSISYNIVGIFCLCLNITFFKSA